VDCPVSGSPTEARSGKLILIAGGDMADVTRAEPVLKLLGNDWKYTGGVGTAKVVKIVNNMMSMGNVLVAAEAFALGVAAGVGRTALRRLVGGGRSHHFTKRPNAIMGDCPVSRWKLSVGGWLGRVTRMPTPSASSTREPERWRWRRISRPDIVSLLAMCRIG
jgi:3-hydroxyisobutyrate dehydrogenase